MHRVVKPFPYSEDGFTLVSLVEGDEREFGNMADGLAAEGWIVPQGTSYEIGSHPVVENTMDTRPVDQVRRRRGK